MTHTQEKVRDLAWTRWVENKDPKHITVPAHGSSVVTCLIFSHGRIISASDDRSIHVYSPETGELIHNLAGHTGGVWSLQATKDTLVSGSTDMTIRVWDLNTGKGTHIFGGHTSTVRCLALVQPELVEVPAEGQDGGVKQEKWPKRTLVVSGGRDYTMRVWTLPKAGDPEYLEAEDLENNPYHRVLLKGHDHTIRALVAQGRTAVSGSYDHSVRVWDIIDGTCKWVMQGHTEKVYSLALDLPGKKAYSGSMDLTAKIWDISNGTCLHTLKDHTSLVGLIALSPSYLVSASADATVKVWDPKTGELKQSFAAHKGAITSCAHDEFKVLSGSEGSLMMWNIRDGTVVRELLTGITGVWQVAFEGRWCAAASNHQDSTMLHVWDFGKGDGEEQLGGESEDEFKDDGDEHHEANERIEKFAKDKQAA